MKRYGRDLVEYLCQKFGPTGFESEVADAVVEQLGDDCDSISRDTFGNVYALVRGVGDEPRDRIMISSHMDEVGFMIRSIDSDGYIKFARLGGIDPRVIYGKQVVLGNGERKVNGVIAAKAIHHKKPEERGVTPSPNDMYIDIGAKSREEVEEYVSVGDFGVFNSDFVSFGTNGEYMKGKAIDDRAGCCAMIEVIRRLRENGIKLPFDVFFCFTTREEVGLSGARVAAEKVKPSRAIILETTAIGDVAGAPAHKRVAEVGSGGVVSLMDRSTIYDTDFVRFTLDTAEKNGIAAQVKRYVSGGNDAGHIHKSGKGVKCVAISMGTRYLHSHACVASYKDYESIRELVYAMLNNLQAEV